MLPIQKQFSFVHFQVTDNGILCLTSGKCQHSIKVSIDLRGPLIYHQPQDHKKVLYTKKYLLDQLLPLCVALRVFHPED